MKIARWNAATIAAAGLALAAPVAHAATVDYFLRIDGIPGESVDARHKDEIEVLSWSMGASRDPSKNKGACVRDLAFTKTLDRASPLLLANAVSGMTIPTATLVARKAGAQQLEFLKVELKDVVITSIQDGASGDSPFEQVTIGFGTLTLQYRFQRPDGTLADAAPATVKGGC